jgi:hypothetical protein
MGAVQQKNHIGALIRLGETQTHQATHQQQHDSETQANEQAPPPWR